MTVSSSSSNGSAKSSMPLTDMTNGALPDAFADALGRVLAQQRHEWRSERELAQAENRRAIAELEAKVANLTLELHQMYAEKLAGIQNGVNGADGRDGKDGSRDYPVKALPGRRASVGSRERAL